MNKKIVILGSTGSIGKQTLDVISRDEALEVVGLTTNVNIELLYEQILVFNPKAVAVMNKDKAYELSKRVKENHLSVEVYAGLEGLVTLATLEEAEMVVTSVVGMIGLMPTLEAIKKHKIIALANKETLVTAGDLVMGLAKEQNVSILPVDSEHAAIFECLQGQERSAIRKILLTASGGPFRTLPQEELAHVTVEQALKHPNWSMGSKITIDSATLMNKGLEVIEAKHLFDVELDQIQVVVHPQSIIHSMVEYEDGAILAQLGSADMRHPISYALHYPTRKKADYIEPVDFCKIATLTFEAPRVEDFPCLNLAYEALKVGGTLPAVLNAANEVAVEAFLKRQIGFMQIPQVIHETMAKHICISKPSLEEILEVDGWARTEATAYCRKKGIE